MENTENQTQTPDMVNQDVQNHGKGPSESFAELRKAKDDLEKQLWQAQKERELIEKQMQSQMQQRSAPVQQEEEFDFNELEREEFPDGKKLAKAFSTFNKKMSTYEQKLYEKDIKIQALEFAVENSDFKEVVTPENIERYIKSDEDNREAVEKASNPLRKVYNLIKKSAAYQADMAEKNAKAKPTSISQEQRRVDEKENKPKVGSIGVRSEAISNLSAISNSKMTREQRNAIWAETQAAARK